MAGYTSERMHAWSGPPAARPAALPSMHACMRMHEQACACAPHACCGARRNLQLLPLTGGVGPASRCSMHAHSEFASTS